MKQPFEQIIDKIESFVVLEERIKTKEKLIYVSPFSGSSKSLIIKKIAHSENQILLMLPSVQAVNEVKVELSILGLEKSVVAADDLSPEMLQEKLTDLNSRKNFVLLSTYELLKLKLPSKQNIEANTTNIEIGGNLS